MEMTDQTMQGYYVDSYDLLFRKIKALKLTRFRTSFPSKRVARDRPRSSIPASVPGSFFYPVERLLE